MTLGLRLAWRELHSHPRFSLFFAVNLALGLFGFAMLAAFKGAFDHALDIRSRNLLSADLAISCRRRLTDRELRIARDTIRKIAGPGSREAGYVSLFTMARGPRSTRLAELDAIDTSYPFYGQLKLARRGGITGDAPKEILRSPLAWIHPDLGIQLGLRAGDSLKLGEETFRIDDTVANDTGTAWRGASLAPRLYIGLPFLERTGLIREGSTVSYTRFFKLPPGTPGETTEQAALALDRALPDPAVQIRTHRQASEEVGQLVHYLDDFLGLVALVALFLSGIGSAYLFRSYLSGKVREIAILQSLGASPAMARRSCLIQLAILGSLASALGLGACLALLPALRTVVRSVIPFPLDPTLDAGTATATLTLGIGASLLLGFPLVQRLKGVMTSALFQESADPKLAFTPAQAWNFAPALACFWGLSVWQAHSWKMGSLFFGLFLGSGTILALAGSLTIAAVRAIQASGHRMRCALRNIWRSRVSSLSCFVSIGIGALLLNVVPEIEGNIRAEFTRPDGLSVPSLFLFDIQQDQLDGLRQLLRGEGLALQDASPLVRSRLEAVNGKPFEKTAVSRGPTTREEEEDRRFRNRGFNLSYRERLERSESIYEGRLWKGPFQPGQSRLPQISIEHRFADRLGIHPGDRLDFDVEGIPVSAEVTSLRRIRWTSFEPNFFILFQPGVLEDAPRSYIATLPELSWDRKIEVQNRVVDRFPNISMVDVTELVTRILEIFRQMGAGIQAIAGLTLVAAVLVLFSIASHQAGTRAAESSLLKVLGAPFSDILATVGIEFGILGLFSSGVGTLLSYGVSYVMSVVVFEGVWVFSWRIPLLSIGLITALGVLTALLATHRVLKRKPVDLLRSQGP